VTHHEHHDLSGRRVAVVAADMVEQIELTEPWKALEESGAKPELVSIKPGQIQGFNHFDKADTFAVDRRIDEVDADDYDALFLPGGVGNPDILRLNEKVVRFIRRFFEQGKPVAAICHAPWTLVEADVVRGRRLTSWPSLRTDIRNAGGDWVDEEVVVDRGLVTSRKPDDLPAFIPKMLEEFAEGTHAEQRAAVHADAAAS
jgi:protease I